jgi:hypothetical protein
VTAPEGPTIVPTSGVRHWTDEEERRPLELREAKTSVMLIAKILKRTEVAVANRIALLKAKGVSY